MAGVSEDPPQPEIEEPSQQRWKPWGWDYWILGTFFTLVAVLVLMVFALPMEREPRVQELARQMQAVNNCRQIIISLKSYASDHGGKYPDGATANDAFRELIKAGLMEDERVFSAPKSPYVGDNEIGEAPEYARALQARENHWAMTKGLTDDSPGDWPLVFENPALAVWPPWWDPRFPGEAKPGRIGKYREIVVGRNDGSVMLEKLTKDDRPVVTLQPIKDGKNLFELAGPHEILDVAR